MEDLIWHLILISSWWYSYKFIDIWRLFDKCTLPLCCLNSSQKCEWKIIKTEKTQRKNKKEKTSFWKHEIGFLNFLRNITFTILGIFESFIIFLVNSETLNDARHTFIKLWVILFNSALNVEQCGSYFCFAMCRFVGTSTQ